MHDPFQVTRLGHMRSANSGYVSRPQGRSLSGWYCVLLGVVLLGYVFIGKGFAYQGIPPLLIGEITLVLGAIVFLQSGLLFRSLGTAASLSLALLMGWVVIRTVPYLGIYGLDAPRDAVIVGYGVFTFIVIGLMLEDRDRLNAFLRVYAKVAVIFVLASPFIFVVTRFFADSIPTFPAPNGEPISVWSFRPGQFGVHLAGAALFAFLGLIAINLPWLAAFAAAALMASATSRGAMLAIVIPIIVVGLLSGRVAKLIKLGCIGLAGVLVALAVETAFVQHRDIDTLSSHDRPVSIQQAVAGVFSIFESSGAQLSQTKEWRLKWWEIIHDDTFNGPYFWTGKGFGINLADADGFQQPHESGAPPLRDPHSVHLTLLARAGVPGLALWIAVIASWSWLLIGTSFHARAQSEQHWSDVLLFIYGYGLAVIVESSFDIGMAGPMMGIPFWCIYGLGVATAIIYRTRSWTAPQVDPTDERSQSRRIDVAA